MLQPPVSPLPQASTSSLSLQDAMIDYTNLYIKNLDLNVKSADLFNSFRKFGRIISARVMKNPQTKQSKGFGFVSFSKPDEALDAKQEMNGVFILAKPVVVAFHEPKKTRETVEESPPQNNAYPRLNNAANKNKPRDGCYHNNNIVPKQQQQQQQQPNVMNYSYNIYPMPYRGTEMTTERQGSNQSYNNNNNALQIYDQRYPQVKTQ
jgi:RNA recognition motif-containing protein